MRVELRQPDALLELDDLGFRRASPGELGPVGFGRWMDARDGHDAPRPDLDEDVDPDAIDRLDDPVARDHLAADRREVPAERRGDPARVGDRFL